MIKVWLRPKPDTQEQYNRMILWCLEHSPNGHVCFYELGGWTNHPGSWYMNEEDVSAFHLKFESLYYD